LSPQKDQKRFIFSGHDTETMRISAIALAVSTLVSGSAAFVAPATLAKARSFTSLDVSQKDLDGAQAMIDAIIDEKNCNPVFVRLAWHDSGTFDVNEKGKWPTAGGAIGSIRFEPEINHGANAGLAGAITLLEPVKEKFSGVSYADIFQMASARAIELAGGPTIDMKYGRVDATGPEQCSPEGNLPDAEAGPEGKYGGCPSMEDTTPNGHLRKVFYRMGLGDEEIVALSGAHTFGTNGCGVYVL
jgi:L-ascorbate peroxidase